MKTNKNLSVISMMVVMLACILNLSISSCSKDDEDEEIVGTWVCGDMSYRFDSSGSGRYYSGDEIWGSISYTYTNRTVFMKITYVNDRTKSTWRGEDRGTYDSANDTFYARGRRFTRKK